MISQTVNQNNETNGTHGRVASLPAAGRLDVSSHYVALMRQLLTNQMQRDLECLAVGLTSCTPGEGVTTAAINLALTAAQQSGRRVLLVDATSRQAGVERQLGIEQSPGLVELSSGSVLVGDCISSAGASGLSVLGNGLKSRQAELNLDPTLIRDVLEEFKSEFDLIVFDMSHAHDLSDCFSLAEILDGVLLVLEAGKVDSHVARRVLRRFRSGRTPVLGTIFNKCH